MIPIKLYLAGSSSLLQFCCIRQISFLQPSGPLFLFIFFFFPKSPITYLYVNQILHSTRLICMFALSHCEGFFELLICETYWIVIPVQHVLFSCTLRRQLTFFLIGFPTNGAEVVGWRRGFKKKKKDLICLASRLEWELLTAPLYNRKSNSILV